jgi:hypothetical protein
LQVANPIGSGLVTSLARPGANVTGFTNFEPAIGGKWLELLKEIAPGVTRAIAVFNPETHSGQYWQSLEAARWPDWLKMKNPACEAVRPGGRRRIGARSDGAERQESHHDFRPEGWPPLGVHRP